MKPEDMIPFDPFNDPDSEKAWLKRIIVVLFIIAVIGIVLFIAQNSDCGVSSVCDHPGMW